jgi:hypothetical protein
MLTAVGNNRTNGHSTPTRAATIAARPRSNTAHSYTDRMNSVVEDEAAPVGPKMTIPKLSRTDSLRRDFDHQTKPVFSSRAGAGTPPRSRGDSPPEGTSLLTRAPTEPSALLARTALRPVRPADDYETNGNGNYWDRSDSPTALGSTISRTTSWNTDGSMGKKAPPPPPSRAKKPPPPPPMKRATYSASEIPLR